MFFTNDIEFDHNISSHFYKIALVQVA